MLCSLGLIDVKTLQRLVSETIFGERVTGLSERDIEVIGFSVLTEYYATTSLRGNLVLPSFLPTYETFTKPKVIYPETRNTHLLLGCITPYSALGHRLFTQRRYGETSLNLTIDIKSPYMVDIDKSAVQASALDIPLGDLSLRTVLTNNLFRYIDEHKVSAILLEVQRVLEVGGEFFGIESDLYRSNILRHFPASRFQVDIIPAFKAQGREEEKKYIAYPNYIPRVVEVPGLLGYRIIKS